MAAGESDEDRSDESILPGRTFWRGDDGYEALRQQIVWNGFKPARWPAVIVRARTAEDVAVAVRHAARLGLKVKARSGGHNWTASFLRDGAMVIDLGDMDDLSLDAANSRASVGPAVHGGQLQAALAPHGLFFPTGHCSDVAVSGYLMQGGWGWNGPKLGLANGLVEAIELVTADGRIVCASATENTDYFWAARGAGAGFFGVVTRWHLKLLPRPALCVSQALYTREQLAPMLRWAAALGPVLPHEVEMNVFVMPGLDRVAPGGFAFVNLACFAPTDAQARQILRAIDTCPAKAGALMNRVAEPSTVAQLYEALDRIYLPGLRYGVDNMFTDAPPADVVRMILAMADDIPTPQSHVLWHPYPLERVVTDTSMSVMGTNYLVGYGASPDEKDDASVQGWATRHMKNFQALAVGMQLGDENLAARPDARFLKGDAFERLETLRQRHDPQGRFHSYLRGAG